MKKILLIATIIMVSIFTVAYAVRTVSQEKLNEIIASSSTASIGENDHVLESLQFTVDVPVVGKNLAAKVVGKTNLASYEFNIPVVTDASSASDNYAIWSPNDTTAKASTEYSIRIVIPINLKTISISKNCTATINGDSVSITEYDGKLIFEYKFPATGSTTNTRPTTGIRPTRPITSTSSGDVEKIKIKEEVDTEESGDSSNVVEYVTPKLVLKTIDIEVAAPEIGKALPETYTVKSNLVDKASEYKIGEEKEDNLGTWTPSDKEVKAGTKYTFNLDIALKNSLAEISEDLKITINNNEVKPTIKDGVYTVKAEFETKKAEESKSGDNKPNENNMYNHFGFTITAPKIGEKPATTAKEMGEEYKVKKVEWLTTDEKFVEGETYKVQIYFDLINKNVRSDYFATVNGLVADLPNGDENYAKNTMYAEFTFPTLRDTSKKAIWTNASTWAIEELSKAAEKGLIPDSLNKEDLTKNVTRKEFAHIAVRLYEALTGKGIFVTDAPFADTDDKEIAKAYTVGITEGTDKEKKLFSPDKEITREQMATMMVRALDKAYVDTFVDLTKVTKFADDADLHDWSRDAVYFMANVEIIKGVGNNNFGAKGTATREQAILVAIRSLEKFIK